MTNRNKAKGTRFETGIVTELGAFFGRLFGLRPYRPAQTGVRDVGDIHGVSPFVLQAKDDKSHSFSEWLDGPKGVHFQAANAEELYGAVIVKRPRRPIMHSYALLRLDTLARLILRLRRAEALLERHAPDAYAEHANETRMDAERTS